MMISVEKALKTILVHFRPLGLETVNILEARARIIGENIVAPRNIPSAANSAMDGYAVCHADVKNLPATLKIIEDIPAGKIARKKVNRGEAARIMTGAVIPRGADTVIRQEDTQKDGKTVIIFAGAKKGDNIRLAGEDVRKGEKVIRKATFCGRRISACWPLWAGHPSAFTGNRAWRFSPPATNWLISKPTPAPEKSSTATATPSPRR